MERCPVCRARFKEEPICYRCGADLSTLLAVENEAAALEQQAIAWLEAGQLLEARRVAAQVLLLQHRPLAAVVQDFARRELIACETRRLEQLLQ